MPLWDLQETRDQVELRYGYSQLHTVRKCLESIIDRQRYAKYHFSEYRRLLTEHIDNQLTSKDIYKVTLVFKPEERAKLDSCLTRVGANVVACIQSMHSIADIFAHTVYFTLGLNTKQCKLDERKINIRSVTRVLNGMTEFSEIASILNGIIKHDDFVYLDALVNHSKHRSIVGTVLSIDPPADGQPPYTLLFDEFVYDEESHASRDIQSFLAPAYKWISQEIDVCGEALNRALRNQPIA
jgi:hypothetical protein